ncbi:hypothetical protein GCM10022224_033110 [Nonomuraea antimicrobica]|uniref:Uncharacterized protein n=1 Tax=Nonomuraea antimicrobica TaxID=561173 RepID=A0ABP7BQ89_9ACTN
MRVPLAVLASAVVLSCVPVPAAHAVSVAVVAYECTVKGTNERQDVSIDVELTVPSQAAVGTQMTIGWRGAYSTGAELIAPATGMEGDITMYAYAGISGITGLTSATGVAPVGTVIPGEPIPIPETTVDLKTMPTKDGTGQVRPAAINFGLRPQEPLIECEVKDEGGLTRYPLTVGNGGSSSPSPDDSTDDTTEDADDSTQDTDTTDNSVSTVTTTTTETPSGGVDTGAGGLAGPDGRAVMATGLVIVLAALTGLRLRLRGLRRRPT